MLENNREVETTETEQVDPTENQETAQTVEETVSTEEEVEQQEEATEVEAEQEAETEAEEEAETEAEEDTEVEQEAGREIEAESAETAESAEQSEPADGGESMEQLLDQEEMMEKYTTQDVHRGMLVDGEVIDTSSDGWLVDVGYKCEGYLPRKEWTHRALVEEVEEPNVGDKIRVQVINVIQNEEAQLTVSRWRSEFDERWSAVEEALAKSDVVTVEGLRKVKGGLIVNCCGIEGFIPISHLAEEGRGVNPARFIGEEFEVKLLEKDRRKRRLVFSRRSVLEEELKYQRDKFYDEVEEGTVLEGTVSSITSFGVFVNLGPIEGLVHISELSWQRNAKPKEIVKKGDTQKVKVIGIDQERDRISLSIKQLQNDPWESVGERWQKDDKTTGTVTNLTDFGAFVEIEPGVEGLVHIGDLSWTRIKHPRDVLRKGQEVEVQILDVDQERRRISLGYKQLHDPWDGVGERYWENQDVDVKVVRLADFGAFVELEKGVEGLIHISQLSRERVDKPGDVLQEGQEVTARILEVKPKERRIRLSLSALQQGEEPKKEQKRDRPAKSAGGKKQQNNSYTEDDAAVTIGDLLGDVFNN
ncbi:MAG: S1 RNA-binding domain-containing protein [Synergistales bacterium]|nr:S1 RNA-binding domain-containing protein [Synergistales bacterium]